MVGKLSAFAAVPLLAGLAFSFFLKTLIVSGGSASFWAMASAAAVFVAFFSIQCLIVESRAVAAGLIFSEAIALIVFFYNYPFVWVFIAFAAVLLSLFTAYLGGRTHAENMIVVRFFNLRKAIVGRPLLGLTLFTVIIAASAVDLATFTLSRTFFNYAAAPMAYAGRIFVSDFSMETTVGAVLRQIAQRSAARDLAAIPLSIRPQVIEATVGRLSETIDDLAKIRIGLNEQAGDALYRAVNHQFRRVPEQARTPVTLALAGFIFLTLTGVSFTASWCIGGLAWLLFQLLLAAQFITISYRNKNSEVITLD